MLTDTQLLDLAGLKTASEYQTKVFRHSAEQVWAYYQGRPMNSAIVKAVAGSGKTTTAVATNRLILTLVALYEFSKNLQTLVTRRPGLRKAPPKVLFLAFNRSIKLELESRLPQSVTAKTFNGLGASVLYGFVRRALNITKQDLKAGKNAMVLKNLTTAEDRKQYGAHVRNLVSKCKAIGMVPPNNPDFEGLDGRVADDEGLRGLCEHFNIVFEPRLERSVFDKTREVLNACLADAYTIDFDEQKYVPVTFAADGPGSRIAFTKYDIIFVDEAQDVNPVDLELIRLSLRDGGMIVAIGDDNQAIYGFRGADVNSINNIRAMFSAIELPLSITYRCAAKIVDAANAIRPGMIARPGAPEGEIIDHDEFDHTLFVPGTDMIVCRNNAPLVAMAYKLIRKRVPIYMMGRDFGKELLGLIENLVGDDKKQYDKFAKADLADLSAKLDEWESRQIAIIREKDEDGDTAAITDRSDTIRVFIADCSTVQQVVDQIAKLFHTNSIKDEAEEVKENLDKVILCTGHKSKGLESERVFVLDEKLLYPKWVSEGSWQYEQEKNLHYVILSRAKTYLGFIDSDDMVVS